LLSQRKKIDLSKELVIVSQPKNIDFEWRFVVIDKQVVTGSQYRENNRVAIPANQHGDRLDLYLKAMHKAQCIANRYKPDKVFIVDICMTKAGNFHLMEIGPFSCAGLYACTWDTIISGFQKLGF